jgi:hypothetical protein
MGELQLTTTLQKRGPAAAIVLDDAQVEMLGEGAKRFPVRVTIGDYGWRGSVTRMGGEFLVGLNKEVRAGAGVEAGDEVEVVLVLDAEPRTVEVPEALERALAGDDVARDAFDGLAYTHRKEFARWVTEARKAETRDRRVAQALEMLRDGRTR